MRKATEILRLRWEQQLRVRQVAQSLSISHSTVIDTLRRAEAAGLSWPLPAPLDDAALEALLYRRQEPGLRRVRPEPDWAEVQRELRRKGVALQLLWIEYKRAAPHGYQYTPFCVRYRQWAAALDVVLRQPYRAGEKMFVDFAGQTIPVIDAATGEVRPGAPLHRGARSEQFHVRGSYLGRGSGELDHRARPRVRVLPRRAGSGRTRQHAHRGDARLVL